ncbi:hypothetical protein [Acidovorax sp. SUPP2825]|uniref:hypothetical protein n=1 Tax=Acidovorax sp. SUPP2825 TaxID=2920879 RepID=UPI0023DE6505|nr:hypothetical protein [Acidovorax sp. SUPP2825]GKS94462.1 hypothetical protein AVAK2825_08025 [Acidovorax sp. SUPP2825]
MKKKAFFLFVLPVPLAACIAYLWITHTPHVHAVRIEKVAKVDMDPDTALMCAGFEMNVEQFNEKFNQAKHFWQLFLDDYSWLPCYYKTTIEGKEYRLRAGGLAEVVTADGDITYFDWGDGPVDHQKYSAP